MIAIVQPRYGRTIHSGGKLTPTTASTLFALFAKTIELSFVTVFVTFLGQVSEYLGEQCLSYPWPAFWVVPVQFY